MDIASIDPNFKVESQFDKPDVRYFDVRKAPFQVYGVYFDDGKFRRMPEHIAAAVNPRVLALHANTAGGRVRFKTDSPYVAVYAKMPQIGRMPHFPLTGSAGFDLYVEEDGEQQYTGTYMPPYTITDGFESVVEFPDPRMREITLHMPLYSEVSELYIGVSGKTSLDAPKPYLPYKPIVYYGSSITQGGCSSRPGLAYENVLSRRLSVDHVNLGFSGNARAEDTIAEYISRLDMSVFVYDYDHNAPTVEHLQNTHERMFRTVRKAQPQLPIVLLSRPKYRLTDEENKRLEIIRATYNRAKDGGDQNVYLIDGPTLMQYAGDEGTVDNCHPNDLGFASMARVLGDLLEKFFIK